MIPALCCGMLRRCWRTPSGAARFAPLWAWRTSAKHLNATKRSAARKESTYSLARTCLTNLEQLLIRENLRIATLKIVRTSAHPPKIIFFFQAEDGIRDPVPLGDRSDVGQHRGRGVRARRDARPVRLRREHGDPILVDVDDQR